MPRTFETRSAVSIQVLQRASPIKRSEGLGSILILNDPYTILDGSHRLSTLPHWVERQRSKSRSPKPVRFRTKGVRA